MGSPSLLTGDLPNPGIEPGPLALQVDSLPTELSGKPRGESKCVQFLSNKHSDLYLSDSHPLMAFVIKHSNSLRFWRLPAQPPRKSHNGLGGELGSDSEDRSETLPQRKLSQKWRQPRTFWLPAKAAAGGDSHGHLPSGSEPAHSPVARFLSGLTSLRVLQALRPGPGLRLPVP